MYELHLTSVGLRARLPVYAMNIIYFLDIDRRLRYGFWGFKEVVRSYSRKMYLHSEYMAYLGGFFVLFKLSLFIFIFIKYLHSLVLCCCRQITNTCLLLNKLKQIVEEYRSVECSRIFRFAH